MNEHKNSDRHLKRMDEMNNKIDLKALAYNHKPDIIENYNKIHNKYPDKESILDSANPILMRFI